MNVRVRRLLMYSRQSRTPTAAVRWVHTFGDWLVLRWIATSHADFLVLVFIN